MWLVYVFKKQAERCWSSCGVCLGVSVLIWFWNNECFDLDFTTVHCCRLREQSRLSYSYESFINMRKRQGKEREVWRKQQLQYSPSRIPEKHSSHSRLCVCVCVWTYGRVCTLASPSPSQFQLNCQSNFGQLLIIILLKLSECCFIWVHLIAECLLMRWFWSSARCMYCVRLLIVWLYAQSTPHFMHIQGDVLKAWMKERDMCGCCSLPLLCRTELQDNSASLTHCLHCKAMTIC